MFRVILLIVCFLSLAGETAALDVTPDKSKVHKPILQSIPIVGWMFKKNRNNLREWEEVSICFRRAGAGHADAQYDLGKLRENGWGGYLKDIDRAKEYYGQAAAQGYEKAQAALKALEANKDIDESLCAICIENPCDYIFKVCYHKVCLSCAPKLSCCPFCRQPKDEDEI